MAGADVVLALGVDWDFRTGYGEKISPDATVIQDRRRPSKIGWNRPAHIGLVADSDDCGCPARRARCRYPTYRDTRMDQGDTGGRAEKAETAMAASKDDSSPVMPMRFGREVGEFFGPDSIVTVDGGDIVSTTARWLQTSTAGHVLDPGPFGTLGTRCSLRDRGQGCVP